MAPMADEICGFGGEPTVLEHPALIRAKTLAAKALPVRKL